MQDKDEAEALASARAMCDRDPYALAALRTARNLSPAAFAGLAADVLFRQLPDGPVHALAQSHIFLMMPPMLYSGDRAGEARAYARRFWTARRLNEVDGYDVYLDALNGIVDTMPADLAGEIVGRALDDCRFDDDVDRVRVDAGAMPLGSRVSFWKLPRGGALYADAYSRVNTQVKPLLLGLLDELTYCPIEVLREATDHGLIYSTFWFWPMVLIARARGLVISDVVWREMTGRMLGQLDSGLWPVTGLDNMMIRHLGVWENPPPEDPVEEARDMLDYPHVMLLLPADFVESR